MQRLDAGKAVKDVANSRNRLAITSEEVFEENIHVAPAQFQIISSSQTVVTPDAAVQTSSLEGGIDSDEARSLKKLDSFGRWMDREIGGDCDESLMASDSGNYWNTLDTDNGDKEVSSLSCHMQLGTDSLGPSLSQEPVVHNRLACSEVREFEYREKPSEYALALRPSDETGNASERLEDLLAIIEGNHINFRDVLIQNFMKVAGLGYEWGLLPLIAAGISPNFRDARGRTALHWAAHYGREDMVIALTKLGVAVGAVDDPTAAFPGEQTAADLASNNIGTGLEAEKAFESAAQEIVPLNGTIDDDISLKESLASLRKSAHAAAFIQAAFRARSFLQRQLTESRIDVSEASLDLVALGSLNKVQKVNHFEDYLHSAAIKIQQKYRGWKGRREFLKIHNRIVKIQAHVRGHQVRKQHKKFVWSVSILEKKFAGVEKALARVQSMVRHPEARDQYMRLVAKFESTKLDDRGSSK
ncbi:hypothetical protein K7X08_030649 [Anisodus acutangulus]|uniref:Uncharacterized protein n=1 Tax=Anisodus acutangulus TaxID=402998 RepID=A0A9Q1QV96_9SOLA|nr:hypothetical protein K7X08_030649 [Anisodus acutangulus]